MSKIQKIVICLMLITASIQAQDKITLQQDDKGAKLLVNGSPFMINGMNWNYDPIGTNYNYSLWKQSDETIIAALDHEMSLLKNMGVNAIRQYTGVPAKWITYIYEKYGIYTMLNHSFGRYGLTINGAWLANTDYSDARVREQLLSDAKQLATDYKNTKVVLLFLLVNEKN